ncbi:nitroreductase family protein [Allocoprobacillus halotolerans]|uniref:Nitroreductase family protein n=1 Tax=Allocoprobacillus halotolerans TaxID=2944914 RepID=A0ABY5I6Y2_9FIRM|nr:nitroreductase family protein [Allocoprobacillus halotolerans]UTY39991.1 nitroreductase family protein [Allocoprobacillus halotolerans]
MNQVIKELFERKSVRAYREDKITLEEKEMILKAAMQAPTAGNMALYSVIEIQDQAIKDQLAITCDHQPFISQAPLVLLF